MGTIVECADRVPDINFAAWNAESGVTCLLFDIDGTLRPLRSSEMDEDIVSALVDSRNFGIEAIGLVTHNKNPQAVEQVRQQIGADAAFWPNGWKDRKPRPTMIGYACERFDVEPEQVGMIGDKFTADIKAAVRAGVSRAAWVDRLGRTDVPGDRLRRPYEELRYRKVLEAVGPTELNNQEAIGFQISRLRPAVRAYR
jgi:predicted HAD superfamily phosphohydrolase YqeG